jgi:hypothetical protein
MDKQFLYSLVAFGVFTGLPIGGIMLSIALYPDSALTAYTVENFGLIIGVLFLVTISAIGGVFYAYTGSPSQEASTGSD